MGIELVLGFNSFFFYDNTAKAFKSLSIPITFNALIYEYFKILLPYPIPKSKIVLLILSFIPYKEFA